MSHQPPNSYQQQYAPSPYPQYGGYGERDGRYNQPQQPQSRLVQEIIPYFDEITTKLNNLTKVTKEIKDAVEQTNKEIANLQSEMNQLSKKISREKNNASLD